jgi:diguanylate cyclase (GGDEF)-like protein
MRWTLPGRDGGTLRARLMSLVLVPLLGVTAMAAWEVHQRSTIVAEAGTSADLLKTAAKVSNVSRGLLDELLPGLARAIIAVPAMVRKLGTSSVSLDDIGLTNAQVHRLRERTDTELVTLARIPRTQALAASIRTDLSTARQQIDSGVDVSAGFDKAQSLVGRLATAQDDLIARATDNGLGGSAGDAARNLEQAAQVVQYGQVELAQLAGDIFPALAEPGDGEDTSQQDLVKTWGGYSAAVDTLLAHGSAPVVRALETATDTPATRSLDAGMAAAVADSNAISLPRLVGLYRADQARGPALNHVLDVAVKRATSAAADARHSAVEALWSILAVVVILLAASCLIGWLVLRSVTVPLRRLATSSRQVSEGVLDDVRVAGPREVRTVARGLGAAVASLRKISAQAEAVAAGELDSPVVRQPLPGPLGQVVHASVETIVGAIHERDAAQTDLAYRAAHDPLTELSNRMQAMQTIESSLARARSNGRVTGLMFIDLDHFKVINDTFGHDAGDAVLIQCAQRMKHVVRGHDTVARLGGDEFVILLEDVTQGSDVVGLAQRVVETLAAPIEVGHREVRVGGSVGVAICTEAGIDASRLLREADAAAYQAKKAGRGRFTIFDDVLRAELERRTELDHAIAHGLRHGEFVLYYQPVVDIRSGRPHGVEALIRWNRPGHGIVPPDEFIPAAETSSLINDIGRWTLLEASAQLARWDNELGQDSLTVAVNISGRHLSSDELVDDVRAALDASGIAPQRLVIELTETVLVENLAATGNLLALREMGVQVAIDDFGTGFTSIGQLLQLPIDTLKIDRSFVASADPAHKELVALMARAAHAFGLSVVAEGVEEQAQVGNLTSAAIESAQGFLYARPQAPDAVLTLMRMPTLPALRAGEQATPASV